MPVTSIFNPAAISEAVSAQCTIDAANGRVNATVADLFVALGLPLIQKGKKGASPKGAAEALRALTTGDAPAKKGLPVGILAPKQGWPEVAQALHAYVTTLAGVGACDAPAALPAWADPVAIAAAKAAKAAKAAATREANKAAPEAEAEAEAEAASEAASEALTPTGAANFLIAAIEADMDCLADAIGLKLYQVLATRYAGRELEKTSPMEVSVH